MQNELAKESHVQRVVVSSNTVIESYRELVKCYEQRIELADRLDTLNNEIIENLKEQIKLLYARLG